MLLLLMLQGAVAGAEMLRKQLSNHWTVIGDMALTEIETPVSYVHMNTSYVCFYLSCYH